MWYPAVEVVAEGEEGLGHGVVVDLQQVLERLPRSFEELLRARIVARDQRP
jgi:hypothetical protein